MKLIRNSRLTSGLTGLTGLAWFQRFVMTITFYQSDCININQAV